MSEIKNSRGSKNTLLIILVILLMLLVVGGGAFAGYYFASRGTGQTAGVLKQSSITEATFSADEFTLNLADENKSKFIKTNIYLAYDSKNKKLAKELETKKPHIRNVIIDILRSKKADDVSYKQMDNLKKELLDNLNPLFEKGKLTDIYFYDILVQ